MARLYSNENFPLPMIEELRRLGHDVLTIQETGMDNRKVPDPEVLMIAHSYQRALLTLNRKDFRRLRSFGGKPTNFSRWLDSRSAYVRLRLTSKPGAGH